MPQPPEKENESSNPLGQQSDEPTTDKTSQRACESLVDPESIATSYTQRVSAHSNSGQHPDVGAKYQVIEKLGQGGMGEVFLAKQLDPQRKVALKVVKTGSHSKETLARFEAERRSLALMTHPNIASVFDAGLTKAGNPFFVMEYVEGTPLRVYCDQKKLTIDERLRLFVKICDGVSHAHQKGIVHRDLKPGNILIQDTGDGPNPKIIDFGLAKATDQSKISNETIHTEIGKVVGTVNYLSPEQAGLHPGDIDTRSDIYTLGVILYELLVGSTPVDKKTVKSKPILETLELIRNTEPTPLSRKLKKSAGELNSICQHRKISESKLQQMVRGDLESITGKALAIERKERYQTATQLAEDVNRFLNCEPVQARPTSQLYRFKKLILRNRFASATLAISMVGLVVALCVSISLAVWANKKAKESQESRQRVFASLRKLKEFSFSDIMKSSSAASEEIFAPILAEYEYWSDKEFGKKLNVDYALALIQIAERKVDANQIQDGLSRLDQAKEIINKYGSDNPQGMIVADARRRLLIEFINRDKLRSTPTIVGKDASHEKKILELSKKLMELSSESLSDATLQTLCESLERVSWRLYKVQSSSAFKVAVKWRDLARAGIKKFPSNQEYFLHEAHAINRMGLYVYKGCSTKSEREEFGGVSARLLFDESISLIEKLMTQEYRSFAIKKHFVGFSSNRGMFLSNLCSQGLVTKKDVLDNFVKPRQIYEELITKYPDNYAFKNTMGVLLLNNADALLRFEMLDEDKQVREKAIELLEAVIEATSYNTAAGLRLDLVQLRLVQNHVLQNNMEAAYETAAQIYARNPHYFSGDIVSHSMINALILQKGTPTSSEKAKLLADLKTWLARLHTIYEKYPPRIQNLFSNHELFEPYRNLPEFKEFYESRKGPTPPGVR